jgi:hypothetical protein
MIPTFPPGVRNRRGGAPALFARCAPALFALCAAAAIADGPIPTASAQASPAGQATPASPAIPLERATAPTPAPLAPTPLTPAKPLQPIDATAGSCLPSGDGYLRAHLRGAIDADIDWANRGTVCEGEAKSDPAGVRMSFRRLAGRGAGGQGQRNLLFVFGVTGVGEGQALRTAGTNLTIMVQGTSRVFGTLGDTRCAIERLTQRRLGDAHSYRVEARGFCTQPAHAVRGDGEVLVSRFDFAGRVNYAPEVAP